MKQLKSADFKMATNGSTPLDIAVKINDIALVKYFVEDLQIYDALGDDLNSSLLTTALTKGNDEISLYLLSKDVKVTPDHFYTASK